MKKIFFGVVLATSSVFLVAPNASAANQIPAADQFMQMQQDITAVLTSLVDTGRSLAEKRQQYGAQSVEGQSFEYFRDNIVAPLLGAPFACGTDNMKVAFAELRNLFGDTAIIGGYKKVLDGLNGWENFLMGIDPAGSSSVHVNDINTHLIVPIIDRLYQQQLAVRREMRKATYEFG
ncbi:MAG: hypothetical protein LBF84_00990 [Holosporales bacterium]|nr:hypothetical protein [Holosporales bacterium]